MDGVCFLCHLLIVNFLFAFGESSIIGPYTKVKGGNRPYKSGEFVTHVCVTEGGNPKPTLKWICLEDEKNVKTIDEGNKMIKEVTIKLTDTMYNCACHANHSSWNSTKTTNSKTFLLRTAPLIANDNRDTYLAGMDHPVTIKLKYYAYPDNVSVIMTRMNETHLESNYEIVHKKEQLTFTFRGENYHAIGGAVYWKMDILNESDYGQYIMQLTNDVGNASFIFNIYHLGNVKLMYVLYGIGTLCILVLLFGFIANIVRCYKQKTVKSESFPEIQPRTTLNTSRGVYTDRAVFRRAEPLPDVTTVDRICSLPAKPRRVLKVPPILAVFRKSLGLPDCDVISDVHEAMSRSASNIEYRNDNEEQAQIRRPPASLPRELNYPNIEIRNSTPRTPTIRRQRIRTNYSQIDFEAPVLSIYENKENPVEEQGAAAESSYGRIFFQSASLPPRANK